MLREWVSETTVSGDHFLSPYYSWEGDKDAVVFVGKLKAVMSKQILPEPSPVKGRVPTTPWTLSR